VRKTDADNSTISTTLQPTTGLGFALAANTTYSFDYYIRFQTTVSTTGIALALTGPGSPAFINYAVNTPVAADGTAGMFSGWGTAYDDQTVGTGVQTAGTAYVARIHGIIQTGATPGTLLPRFRTEVAGSSVSVKTDSWGALYTS
jgi:hypothetical protein